MSWTTGTLLGGILVDWDGVELRPEVVELALVPARGKWRIQNANTTQNTTIKRHHHTHGEMGTDCCTHNTHEYCVLTDRCD